MEENKDYRSGVLFRCSQLGKIMTEPKDKTQELGETCKTYLVEEGIEEKYGRNKELVNRYIKKGLQAEQDAITLYSRVKKTMFKKNEFCLSNRYISGTPDLYTGPIIHEAGTIIDIKCSWDIFTYFKATTKDLNKLYYYQLQGYMALTGATEAVLAYCLVDTPEPLVEQEIRNLEYKMGKTSVTDNNYVAAAKEIQRLSKYDDIPMHERVTEITVERNDADIERIYDRVKLCRKWMNENLFKTKEELVKT